VAWDEWAAGYADAGLRNWAAVEPTWGIWGIPEAQAGVLPSVLDGLDSIELGCGTGYVSAWLARRGVRPVGLDNSPAQLKTARALQDRFGLRFPVFQSDAERVPLSTAPASGAIRTPGSPKRPGCCARAAS
jgi:SAM-dependent methyltransferase